MAKMIVTGDGSFATDQAVNWLRSQGATVENHLGLSIITLSDNLKLEKGSQSWAYNISLADDVEEAQPWVAIELDIDPTQTQLYLEQPQVEDTTTVSRPAMEISQDEAASLNGMYSGVEA